MKTKEKQETQLKLRSTILKQVLMEIDIACCDIEDSIQSYVKENKKLKKELKGRDNVIRILKSELKRR